MLLTEEVSLMLQTAIQWLSLFLMFEVMHIRQYLLLYKLSPFSGYPLIQARVSSISEKHSNKNNKHNWHGCLACVPEQKGVGSRFAAYLEGHHGCFSLESVTSQLFLRALALGGAVLTHGAMCQTWAGCLSHPRGQPCSGSLSRKQLPILLQGCPSKQGWTGTLQWHEEPAVAGRAEKEHGTLLWILMCQLKKDFCVDLIRCYFW